jgi:two-component system invasion response regulator UvrY
LLHIAYIEPQELFAELIVSALKKHFPEVNVWLYRNGLEFESGFPKQGYLPALVIMDISMPEKNGYETTEWLQCHYPNIPILITSYIREDDAIVLLSQLGAKGAVSKNASLKQLFEAIDAILQGEYYFTTSSSPNSPIKHSLNKIRKHPNPLQLLTTTEKKVLNYLFSDKSSEQIALSLNISVRTFEKHKQNISQKTGIKTREGLMIFALKHGFVS